MKFLLINIDDDVTVKSESAACENYQSATAFINALKNDKDLMSKIFDPSYVVCILIDEHLPWDNYEGKDIYEFIGKFSQPFSIETKRRIFPIGVSSNKSAQEYMPELNRMDKGFQLIVAHRPEYVFQKKEDKEFFQNVAEIFSSESYFDYELGRIVKYSPKANKLALSLEGMIPQENKEHDKSNESDRFDNANIA